MKSIKFYTVLIAVLFLSLFNSCHKEEAYIDNTISKDNRIITKKTISFDELQENIKISYFFVKYNRKEKLTSKSIVHDNINDFYVDTNEAIYLEGVNYHSYTFLIYRAANSLLLENLVLASNTEGSYDAYLWQYSIDNDGLVDTTIPSAIIELEGFDSGSLVTPKTNPCINGWRVEIDYMDTDGVVYDEASACPGTDCEAVFHYEPCSDNGSGGTGSGDDGSGDGSGDNGSNDNGSNDNGGSWDNGGTGDDGGSTGTPGGGTTTGGNDNGGTVVSTPKKTDGSSATAGFLIGILESEDLSLSTEQIDWINHSDNLQLVNQLLDLIYDNGNDEETKKFISNGILVIISNPNANPFLGADCRSFEFAKPPESLQRGCGVTDFNHTFYVFGVRPNGSPYAGEVSINMSIAYFTMPVWMTNSQAANAAAIAVTNAIRLTDLYYIENYDATASEIQNFFNNSLIQQLGLVGGTISGVQPFPIPSPAPYLTSFFGASTDC